MLRRVAQPRSSPVRRAARTPLVQRPDEPPGSLPPGALWCHAVRRPLPLGIRQSRKVLAPSREAQHARSSSYPRAALTEAWAAVSPDRHSSKRLRSRCRPVGQGGGGEPSRVHGEGPRRRSRPPPPPSWRSRRSSCTRSAGFATGLGLRFELREAATSSGPRRHRTRLSPFASQADSTSLRFAGPCWRILATREEALRASSATHFVYSGQARVRARRRGQPCAPAVCAAQKQGEQGRAGDGGTGLQRSLDARHDGSCLVGWERPGARVREENRR